MNIKTGLSFKEILYHAKTTPSATASLIIWTAFSVWATIQSNNPWLFVVCIPFILGLTLIPLKVSKMNRNLSNDLLPQYIGSTKEYKISEITKDKVNEKVKLVGTLDKVIYGVSAKPTIRLKDNSGEIYANLIAPIPEDIKKGDTVELYGVVAKHYYLFGFIGIPKLWKPKIYGIGLIKP
ncbi:hypothetical protein [Methanococcus voltae]|uniref:Nucleic acid binding OB-fold tRNA/helicase-type n=1 Tax=Methanococcus voltae TaxID=2188 RepID=A0A8J7UT13_METVO|nr:hypothetical protein [Methanococcus voltae]MBP2171887.1 hypothetical protein [Methanococcus voltae]MBP2201158.1 hypothetical protein [Methanococcus voltae]